MSKKMTLPPVSSSVTTVPCISCGGTAVPVRATREFTYGRRVVLVDAEVMQCLDCREQFFVGSQAKIFERAAEDQVRAEGGILPHEIRRLRKRLGYTQQEFEALLGCGPKTVTRWERDIVTPDATTCVLLRLLEAGHVYPWEVEGVRHAKTEGGFTSGPLSFQRARETVAYAAAGEQATYGYESLGAPAWAPAETNCTPRDAANDNLSLAA